MRRRKDRPDAILRELDVWREGGRARSALVHGSASLAKTIECKKLTHRDENRHLDVKKEINYRMNDLIDTYWKQYGVKKKSVDRERSIIEGIRSALGRMFVRKISGMAVQEWYDNLTDVRELAVNTAERHFHVMHHMMKKAATVWSKITGIDRNPSGQVEVEHVDDTRKRYLSEAEFVRLRQALDEKMYWKGSKTINKTNLRDVAGPCNHTNLLGRRTQAIFWTLSESCRLAYFFENEALSF